MICPKNFTWTFGCADSSGKRQKELVTNNPIYRCEELEDAASMYDSVDNFYEDLAEHNHFLKVSSKEAAKGHDPQCKPEPPSPRPVSKLRELNQIHGYEGLKEKTPDQTYLYLLNDETASLKGQNQDRVKKPQQ